MEGGDAGRIKQHQCADDQRANPGSGQCPVCGRLDIQNEERKGQDEEDDAEPVDRQYAQAVGRQRKAHYTDKTSYPTTRAGDFNQDGLHTDGDQQEDDIGVGQHIEQLFDKGEREGGNVSIGGVQYPLASC